VLELRVPHARWVGCLKGGLEVLMHRILAATALLVLCCAACATVEKSPTDARLLEAQKAFDEGERLQAAGHYVQAVPLLERALALREAAFGVMHPEVASCLNLLGVVHYLQGGYTRAEPLFLRALMIRETALGQNHPRVADSLSDLATLYWAQGNYARAEPLYERALAIGEAALGKNHSDVAAIINNLATLYWAQGNYARAEPLYERALAIFEAALGKNHPQVATTLINLAAVYIARGDYTRVEPLCERALAILDAALGKSHPQVAAALNNLAAVYIARGDYARVEPLCERALAILEAALGKSHPQVAAALNNLAAVYIAQGNYARAEPLYERVLEIQEAALGKNHSQLALSLNNLADLYRIQGNYARAEPLCERALAIREAALGKNHPQVATSLNLLAELYRVQGNHARAEPLCERALAIREAALGKNHPQVATSLNNLAFLYKTQGNYARAEPLYERALAIGEAAFGKNHPEVAATLNNLAELYRAQGNYARAEPLWERAFVIGEAVFGKNHPQVANALNNLAEFYKAQGDYARAESLYERALAIREVALGKNHPHVASALNNLAHLHLAQQHLSEALPLLERAFSISEAHLRQEVFGLSEARLADVLRLLRAKEELLYTLARAHPGNARVRQLALSAALLRKGRSVEEISNTSLSIYRGLAQADRETFERLRALRTQFATLSLAGPGQLAPAEYQRRLKHLFGQGDALEADLARRSEQFRALQALPPPDVIVDRVAAALPKNSALVEFVAYRDWQEDELNYLAIVLFATGRTHTLDLGPAAPIDHAARRLHDALAGRAEDYQPAAQELYALAFRPLVPLLGKVRRLFLSPDGQLSLIPFAVLSDGTDFLVDTFDLTYLTSGKDLLRRPKDLSPARSVVVLADPDFNSPPAASSLSKEDAPAERSISLERFFSTLRSDLTDQPWLPLPGTRKEAEAIRLLFPQAQLLLGHDATKQALLKLPTPGLLHIATHGFFLEDAPAAPAEVRAVKNFGAVGESGPKHRPPDPLLRSGLVLAGVHASEAQPNSRGREDSLVTALELAGLNLWGTQLVVLSACDTGRGDVKLGQGVYGLRRALVAAGAETVVTSLWKVNDETTVELMESYYERLLVGKGRATALREAMKVLRQKQPHPHYWAPFIVIGQDAPLRGLGAP
jgi:CHAT domain-containing protein/Tfp pilus assembly protein PilF